MPTLLLNFLLKIVCQGEGEKRVCIVKSVSHMEIGSKLKRLRIKNNLTQEELADRSELSKGFISQVERDLASPSISTLSDLLQCLGTDLKDFFNDAADTDVVFSQSDGLECCNRYDCVFQCSNQLSDSLCRNRG